MGEKNQYNPDCVSYPGETLAEVLYSLNMTQAELARKTGHSLKTINEIIKGKAPISANTAFQLELVTGISARFWNNREIHYREFLARAAAQDKFKSDINWLKNFPIKEMIKRKWLQKGNNQIEQIHLLLAYFGIASSEQWNNIWVTSRDASYRQSKAFKADPYALAVWIRQGEIEASKIECKPYDENKFRQALNKIRNLTLENLNNYIKEIINGCAEAGVAVVFIQELPRISTYGITRWLRPDKALIQLCIRGKTHDQLCFTFFHEAGHILLHGKRDFFIESKGGQDISKKEKEADSFATEILIPHDEWQNFIAQKSFTDKDIINFAKRINIHQGIIVGRLQHEGYIPYNKLNYLKLRLQWVTD